MWGKNEKKVFYTNCLERGFLSSFLQVTYRLVQVTDQSLEGRDDGGGAVSVVSSAAFSNAPQAVAQVIERSNFISYKVLIAIKYCENVPVPQFRHIIINWV